MIINRFDKVLIYGKSGKGKSTLIDLLCGFKKPNSGKVFFQNRNNKLIKPQEIINYCPQDALILQENLSKNIGLKYLCSTEL